MAGNRKITVEILGDDKTASRAMNSVSKSAGGMASKLGKVGGGLASLGRIASQGLAIGVVAGAAALGKFVADAEESRKISRLTAQAIKSTGGAANVTAKQVGALATAISNKTGVDDEAIQSGQNLLLTFTKVRNEVGKGNDIFNRATQAATDMSVALGTEPKKAALQLGKALNDPIKGITALSRSGVSFTEQQKAQIKTLTESGNTLGAQKLILKELGKEFGGAAAAASSPLDKLKVTAGNLGEAIGMRLLPYVDTAATWLGKNLPGAVSTASGFFKSRILPVIREVAAFIGDRVIPAVVKLAREIGPKLVAYAKTAFDFFSDNILPVLKGVAAFIVEKVVPVVGKLLKAALEGARAALKKIGEAIDRNRPQLQGLFGAFKKVADFVVTKVVPLLGPILKASFGVLGWAIGRAIDTVGFLTRAFNRIWDVARPVLRLVTDAWLRVVGTLLNGAARAFGWVPGIGDKLKSAAKKFQTFRDSVNRSLDGIRDENINVTVTTVGGSGRFSGKRVPIRDGGYVTHDGVSRRRFAGGGYNGLVRGPGGPRDDRIPAMISNGEYVVNAKSTARWRPLLDAINAGASAGKGGGQVVHVHHHYNVVVNTMAPAPEVGQMVLQSLLKLQRQYGGSLPKLRLSTSGGAA